MLRIVSIAVLALVGCGGEYPSEEDAGAQWPPAPYDAGVADAGPPPCDRACQEHKRFVWCTTRGEGCPYDAVSCTYVNGSCNIVR